jgi:hypothetical protein
MTADRRLPIADCRLPTADSGPLIADRRSLERPLGKLIADR